MENVLVTGADRGLGLGICKAFLERGFRVFAGQFMPEWSELSELKAINPDSLQLIPLDVSSMESVKKAMQIIGGMTDTLDIIVNNAGIAGLSGNIDEEIYYEKAKHIFNVNSLGPLRVVEACLPYMKKGEKTFMLHFFGSGKCICLYTDRWLFVYNVKDGIKYGNPAFT